MFEKLEEIHERPELFESYTASELWTDEHTSSQMLAFHLDGTKDISSRNAPFIDRSVEWIASRFRIGKGTRIADFGCGPGLYANRLAKRHAEVTGIDFSRRSIEYARRAAADEKLSVDYVIQNYLEFETRDRFDLILMIMCDFCALSPAQRKAMAEKFHKLLKPGGSLLLDVYSPVAFDQREEASSYEVNAYGGFWSPSRYFCFQNTFKYAAERVVLDKYTIVERGRTRTVYNWMQHFTPEELAGELAGSNFSAGELYADVAGGPYNAKSEVFAAVAGKA